MRRSATKEKSKRAAFCSRYSATLRQKSPPRRTCSSTPARNKFRRPAKPARTFPPLPQLQLRANCPRSALHTVENTLSRMDECKVGRTPWSAADPHVGLLLVFVDA